MRLKRKKLRKKTRCREASSLSPYVEVAADERFPLLVQADPSNGARLQQRRAFSLSMSALFPLRASFPSSLAFGDNNFDIEIRDAGGEKVAQHSLSMIEDTEGVQDWLEVHKKPDDFVSVIVPWGSLFARPPKQRRR